MVMMMIAAYIEHQQIDVMVQSRVLVLGDIRKEISLQKLKARKALPALKEDKCQPRLLHPAKLSFIIEGKIKTFYDKLKQKIFMTN
jgi:hypothetical protein